MRIVLSFIVALAGAGTTLEAQSPRTAVELRTFAGASIPIGTQRNFFRTAPVFGVSPAYQVTPGLHVLATLAWIPEQSRYAVANRGVNLYQYDLGVELGIERALSRTVSVRPFTGFGGGGRTYAYKSPGLVDRTCGAGYATLGVELRTGQAAVRLEGRGNLYCFRSPIEGEPATTRNDLFIALGLGYHMW